MRMAYSLGYALLNPRDIPLIAEENSNILPDEVCDKIQEAPRKRKSVTSTATKPREDGEEIRAILPKQSGRNVKPTVDIFLSELESKPVKNKENVDPQPAEKQQEETQPVIEMPEDTDLNMQLMDFSRAVRQMN